MESFSERASVLVSYVDGPGESSPWRNMSPPDPSRLERENEYVGAAFIRALPRCPGRMIRAANDFAWRSSGTFIARCVRMSNSHRYLGRGAEVGRF
eukprot:scaffold183336_cov31-Tisochrysis_lutea.AAC.1